MLRILHISALTWPIQFEGQRPILKIATGNSMSSASLSILDTPAGALWYADTVGEILCAYPEVDWRFQQISI